MSKHENEKEEREGYIVPHTESVERYVSEVLKTRRIDYEEAAKVCGKNRVFVERIIRVVLSYLIEGNLDENGFTISTEIDARLLEISLLSFFLHKLPTVTMVSLDFLEKGDKT